jgi:hypothetical protein
MKPTATPTLEPLILDLVEWIAREPRPYQTVMDVWRTSCPRLTVWEDAIDRGLVSCRRHDALGVLVDVTDAGRAHLQHHGRGIDPSAGLGRGPAIAILAPSTTPSRPPES